jgi:adenylate cyclase
LRSKKTPEELWREILTGEVPRLFRTRRFLRRIPSPPRCKLCFAPFGRPGHTFLQFLGFRPSSLNRRLCTWCIRSIQKEPGGAEVDMTVLFADVRGSTALAERIPPHEFSALMARFYGTAAEVVDRFDGIVDKFVGDEVMALFIPGFSGEEHAARAVTAARQLLEATGNNGRDPWISLGAGVHTGVAYVGTVGEGDARDFTALGDPVNIAARLVSVAEAGELLVSVAAATVAGLDTAALERRSLDLRGHTEKVEAWVAAGAQPSP